VEAVRAFGATFEAILAQVEKVMVELRPVIQDVLIAMLAEGNVLLEGVPGIGKTYLIKTLGTVLDLQFRRVQFTADLMPADIIGTSLLVQDAHGKRLAFQPGPIFTHLLLADEINRATPKTQAALLEAMEEHTVSVGGVTNHLEEPFFILATQNPIEQDGTYPLPKAQLDKFLFKLLVGYPSQEGLVEVAMRTTFGQYPQVKAVATGAQIMEMRKLVRQVPVASHVEDLAMRLVRATQADGPHATPTSRKYVESGAGPRGLLAILHSAKARALSRGNFYVSGDDVRAVAVQSLRHRIVPNLQAQAEDVTADAILQKIVNEVKEGVESHQGVEPLQRAAQ
jgi:MoxR-like ATPase